MFQEAIGPGPLRIYSHEPAPLPKFFERGSSFRTRLEYRSPRDSLKDQVRRSQDRVVSQVVVLRLATHENAVHTSNRTFSDTKFHLNSDHKLSKSTDFNNIYQSLVVLVSSASSHVVKYLWILKGYYTTKSGVDHQIEFPLHTKAKLD